MPIDPASAAAATQIGVAAVHAITRGGPRRQYRWNKRAMNDANAINRDNALWTLEQNRRLQQEQRVYDSPQAAMQRYKEAGLNPHLIYGSGSGSAGGVFPIESGTLPASRLDAPDASYPDIATGFIQAGQTIAQTRLAGEKAAESEVNQALKSIAIDIAKTNPMLNPGVAQWVATSMQETARLKSLEARQWMAKTYGEETSNYQKKINAEVEALAQRLGLNTEDLRIKNQIFESKEFENAIKKVQAEWLQDATISPEHIRQAMMLILSKMIGK